MANEKILVVDDEEHIAELISYNLSSNGYKVITANNGIDAVKIAIEEKPSLILLDLMIPGKDGYDVCKEVRSNNEIRNTPIIMLTAKSEELDKILGLELGADDYITKPFSVEEFLARLRVTIRRINYVQTSHKENSIFVNGELKIDYVSGCAYCRGKELHLTPIEYKLLCLLAKNIGKVLTHTYITREVWGNAWDNNVASLRVFMATLRKKIEIDTANPEYIQTHIGIGYRMLKLD